MRLWKGWGTPVITGPQLRGTGGTLVWVRTGHRDRGHLPHHRIYDSSIEADRGLWSPTLSTMRQWKGWGTPVITGPQLRGTGGTLFWVRTGHRDRGHLPTCGGANCSLIARLRFVVSQVPKCEGPPPHRRRPVRGDLEPGTPGHLFLAQPNWSCDEHSSSDFLSQAGQNGCWKRECFSPFSKICRATNNGKSQHLFAI